MPIKPPTPLPFVLQMMFRQQALLEPPFIWRVILIVFSQSTLKWSNEVYRLQEGYSVLCLWWEYYLGFLVAKKHWFQYKSYVFELEIKYASNQNDFQEACTGILFIPQLSATRNAQGAFKIYSWAIKANFAFVFVSRFKLFSRWFSYTGNARGFIAGVREKKTSSWILRN